MAGKKLKFVYNVNLQNEPSWAIGVVFADHLTKDKQHVVIASSADRAILVVKERYSLWKPTPLVVLIYPVSTTLISNEYGPH